MDDRRKGEDCEIGTVRDQLRESRGKDKAQAPDEGKDKVEAEERNSVLLSCYVLALVEGLSVHAAGMTTRAPPECNGRRGDERVERWQERLMEMPLGW